MAVPKHQPAWPLGLATRGEKPFRALHVRTLPGFSHPLTLLGARGYCPGVLMAHFLGYQCVRTQRGKTHRMQGRERVDSAGEVHGGCVTEMETNSDKTGTAQERDMGRSVSYREPFCLRGGGLMVDHEAKGLDKGRLYSEGSEARRGS